MVVEMLVPTTVTVTGLVTAMVETAEDENVVEDVLADAPLTVPVITAPPVPETPGLPVLDGDTGENEASPQAIANSARAVPAMM